MVFTTSLLLALASYSACAAPAPAKRDTLYGVNTGKPKVTFAKDGTFTLVSLSDMHGGQAWDVSTVEEANVSFLYPTGRLLTARH